MFQFAQPVQQAIVLGVTLAVLILLFFEKFRPAAVFFVAVLVFLLAGIVETKDFSSAIANESILSIFLLIFITTGIHDHFNIIGWLDKLFGRTSNGRRVMNGTAPDRKPRSGRYPRQSIPANCSIRTTGLCRGTSR